MAYIPQPNRGFLFPFDKKSEQAPDYSGSVYVEKGLLKLLVENHTTPDGLVQIAISCWNSSSKNTGKPYLSLRAGEPFIPKPKFEPKKVEDISQAPEDDEDVPF